MKHPQVCRPRGRLLIILKSGRKFEQFVNTCLWVEMRNCRCDWLLCRKSEVVLPHPRTGSGWGSTWRRRPSPLHQLRMGSPWLLRDRLIVPRRLDLPIRLLLCVDDDVRPRICDQKLVPIHRETDLCKSLIFGPSSFVASCLSSRFLLKIERNLLRLFSLGRHGLDFDRDFTSLRGKDQILGPGVCNWNIFTGSGLDRGKVLF